MEKSPMPALSGRPIMTAYGLLALMMVSGLVPNIWCSLLSLVCFTAAPMLVRRAVKSPDAFLASQAIFIRRTTWLSAVLAGFSMIAAAAYLTTHDDLTALQPCADKLTAMPEAGALQMSNLVTPCIGAFLAANRQPLIISTLIAALPLFLYLGWRIVYGLRAVRRGQAIERPRRFI